MVGDVHAFHIGHASRRSQPSVSPAQDTWAKGPGRHSEPDPAFNVLSAPQSDRFVHRADQVSNLN